jgi:hypothetical protein
MTNSWEKPHFIEVSMNAEIGSYQDEGERGNPPILESESAEATAAVATDD